MFASNLGNGSIRYRTRQTDKRYPRPDRFSAEFFSPTRVDCRKTPSRVFERKFESAERGFVFEITVARNKNTYEMSAVVRGPYSKLRNEKSPKYNFK